MNLSKMLAIAGAAAPSSDCERPARGPHSGFIPNVIVRTHLNQRAWFYDDLIWRKTVLIHCLALNDAESCSNAENLARVQPLIGKELGQSVFIYSITTDPVFDTPAALGSFAQKCGAKDGWLFLTGDSAALALVRKRLFTHGGGQDCSTNLLRYGNEAAGVWGATLAKSHPESIAERLGWITPRDHPTGPLKRGGPPVLAE